MLLKRKGKKRKEKKEQLKPHIKKKSHFHEQIMIHQKHWQ